MPRPSVGVAGWRKLVQTEVDRSSLRAVAAAIGMSASGLDSFLKGTRPHPATVQKVVRWAERRAHTQSPDARDVEAAVALIKQYIDSAPSDTESATRLRRITEALGEP